jgi:hypothetical protein
LLALAVCLAQTSSIFALAGIGIHYGFDMTLKMDDKIMEQTTFDNLKLGLSNFAPTDIPGASLYTPSSVLSGKDIPVYISRTSWDNPGINLGGKIYVDAIPVIDAVELSANFGAWQYNGVVKYPKSISFNQQNIQGDPLNGWASVQYDSTEINYKSLGSNYNFWGLDKTPYAKLHIDATVRKYLLQLPPIVKILKIYGGGGLNVDFATPMLSANLIQDALGSTLNTQMDYSQLNSVMSNPKIMTKVLDEILNKMMTPHFGCHIALGAMVKIPMIPIGIYIDGKYIILFDKMDKYVDIGGSGLLINIGAALAF